VYLNKYFRPVVAPLALAGLLFVTTTLGNLWHHHDSQAERACPICHINHQPAERTVADRLPVLAPSHSIADVLEPPLELAPDLRQIPARAPPAA
jgi:hypothetical protein